MNVQHTPMTVTAARVLNKRAAEACGIDADDQWMIHADEFLDDAKAMLDAAGVFDLLEALSLYSLPIDDEPTARHEFGDEAVNREIKRRAAIVKATGGQS